jgi:tetratricopeptide (TPR) repeat protein
VDTDLAAAIDHHQAGRVPEAIEHYQRILEIELDNLSTLINLGAAHRQAGAFEDAEIRLRRAIDIDPDHAGSHYNLGNTLKDLGRLEDAADSFRRALELNSEFAAAHNNLGDALSASGQTEQAVTCYRQALRTNPDDSDALNNLGNAYKRLGNLPDAIACLEKAVANEPGNPEMRNNLGSVLRDSGRHAEAIAHFQDTLSFAPDHAEAHCLLAFSQLAEGDFEASWREYEWRWKSAEHDPAREFSPPPWDGSPLTGKTVLVWGEQGIGDEIMFASMLSEMIAAADGVVLECEHRMAPLFRRSFPDAAVYVRTDPPASDLTAAPADWQISLGSLGRFLRPNLDSFPKPDAYLKADRDKVAGFRRRYGELAGGKRVVGISWRSGNVETGLQRSTRLGDWLPVLGDGGSLFINLQYGDVAGEIADLEARRGILVYHDETVDQLKNMDDFAAQVASLDLVISAANTTVHVAGALGVKTWALLASPADWRWRLEGTDTPWYGSVKLRRQSTPGDWDRLLIETAAELRS